ncbi:iron-containing redox enzyme family protein [Actinosynnema mirum]|uniref:iron-containing redox enzyme family protein n=1 Tax=Actinosynnema mirum TaxID=40567 RepID=UPI001C9DA193|nr:iron-containing redox enzyme family protein [Actinosynnema mirum]
MSESEHRAAYLRALDPEWPRPREDELPRLLAALAEAPAAEALATEALATGEADAELTGPDELVAGVREWSAAEALVFREILAGPSTGSAQARVLANCAPLALSAGAWLQWLPSAGDAESELTLRVLALYASDVGVGYPHADRGSDYRALLRAHRVRDETPGPRLAGSDRIESAAFRFPALLLAMSRLPRRFRPELLGADLCLRAVGVLPPLAGAGADALGVPLGLLDLGAARWDEPRPALELSLAAAEAVLAAGDGARLRHGFAWAWHELRRWCAGLAREVRLATHPDYDVWRLIWTRARQAAVYHGGFPLEGRPLAHWFADVDAGPGAFLDALARSALVRPGQPDRSPLLTGLIGEKGRMFRVFTEDEVAVLRRWIAQLPPPGAEVGAAGSVREELHRAQRSWSRNGDLPEADHRSTVDQGGDFGSPSPRAAYRTLLGREDPPGLRRFAHDYATRWLARSRYGLDRAPGQLPPRWDPETGLRAWLAAEHERHSSEHEAGRPRVPDREALVESTLQLAPLIMIDGGWLQGFTDHQHASSASGHFLFQTYWDELGNGVRELNHPGIYRDLLREMGVDLPPTDSPEFTAWPGLHDESFELPVYWLCVSRFPRTFLPEILGLNLAMELSGVGGGYRDSRIALRHHGFSTQFVDLHNTIDNVSTGHSAWAVDAIDGYLAELPPLAGRRDDDAVWQRVRTGYRSLNPPEGVVATLCGTVRARTTRYARR